jgi:hypothetical protein
LKKYSSIQNLTVMPLTNHRTVYQIPVHEAAEWTAAWRETNPGIRAFKADLEEIIEIVNEIKNRLPGDNIPGIRMYFGIKPGGEESLVLVAVNEHGQDILHYTDENGVEQSGTYDFTHPCPGTCDDGSILNLSLSE